MNYQFTLKFINMKTLNYKRVTRYFGYILLCAVLFPSCKNDSTKLSELKSPVVIIGINQNMAVVSVKDSTGKVEVFSDSGLQYSLCASRQVGDTIK